MSEPPRQGLFPFPFPPQSGWLVAIFEAGAGRRVALMITGNPHDPAEDDAIVRDAFASYVSWAPGAAVAHDVLCLHVFDHRSRAVRVGAGAVPTVAELARRSGPSSRSARRSTSARTAGSATAATTTRRGWTSSS